MTGTFKIRYSFDGEMDEPYQARTIIDDCLVDAWATSYGEAKSKLIKIIESIPIEEEVEICGI